MPPRIPATMACAGAHQEALGPVRLHVEDEPREEGQVAPGACVRTASAGRVRYSGHTYESHATSCLRRPRSTTAGSRCLASSPSSARPGSPAPSPASKVRAGHRGPPRALNISDEKADLYADALVACCIHPMGVRAQARSPHRTPRRSRWSPSRTRSSKESSVAMPLMQQAGPSRASCRSRNCACPTVLVRASNNDDG